MWYATFGRFSPRSWLGPTGPGSRACIVLALAATVWSTPAAGQVLGGEISDERDDRPISGVLVRLLRDGEPVAVHISDSLGGYRLEAPEPGTYRVEAVRLGYRDFETPLLELPNATGVYEADLLLQPSPIVLPGFTVETERLPEEEVNRRLRLLAGVSPASLRISPILKDELIEHAERGHTITDMIRWGNTAGIIVKETTDGPCYQARVRGCLPIYVDGARVSPELVPIIPLDMFVMAVVLYPRESILYEGGAVLLYSEAWSR